MQTLDHLEAVLAGIRAELTTVDTKRFQNVPPGKLFFKYTQCNKPGCSCMTSDHRHGPYAYLQYTKNGAVKQRYLNRKLAEKIMEPLALRERYERLLEDENFYAHLVGTLKRSGLKPSQQTEV